MNVQSPTPAAMAYAEMAQEVEAARFERMGYKQGAPKFMVTVGKRYDKVCEVSSYRPGQPAGVHAFVERETGDVYKAESWSRPAKYVRGNVATEAGLAELKARFEKSTAYLYL